MDNKCCHPVVILHLCSLIGLHKFLEYHLFYYHLSLRQTQIVLQYSHKLLYVVHHQCLYLFLLHKKKCLEHHQINHKISIYVWCLFQMKLRFVIQHHLHHLIIWLWLYCLMYLLQLFHIRNHLFHQNLQCQRDQIHMRLLLILLFDPQRPHPTSM